MHLQFRTNGRGVHYPYENQAKQPQRTDFCSALPVRHPPTAPQRLAWPYTVSYRLDQSSVETELVSAVWAFFVHSTLMSSRAC